MLQNLAGAEEELQVGTSIVVRCPQRCTGSTVWGKGPYSLASSVAIAARHATGIDGGLVNVSIAGAQSSFEKAKLHGVESHEHNAARRSFNVQPGASNVQRI